jgi:hypothetical protein
MTSLFYYVFMAVTQLTTGILEILLKWKHDIFILIFFIWYPVITQLTTTLFSCQVCPGDPAQVEQ